MAMVGIVAAIVAVLLLYLGYKLAKLLFKVLLWMLALGLLVVATFYFLLPNSVGVKKRESISRPISKPVRTR